MTFNYSVDHRFGDGAKAVKFTKIVALVYSRSMNTSPIPRNMKLKSNNFIDFYKIYYFSLNLFLNPFLFL